MFPKKRSRIRSIYCNAAVYNKTFFDLCGANILCGAVQSETNGGYNSDIITYKALEAKFNGGWRSLVYRTPVLKAAF